ncbi:unnamed protein product, partial [Dibothriocephalus latus]
MPCMHLTVLSFHPDADYPEDIALPTANFGDPKSTVSWQKAPLDIVGEDAIVSQIDAACRLGCVRLLRGLFLKLQNCATHATGFGKIRHIFPAGEPICFEVIENEGTVLDGTISLYKKDGASYSLIKETIFENLQFNWTLTERGSYRVLLHVSNVLSNFTVSTVFAVTSPVIGMELESPVEHLRPRQQAWISLHF